jgi:hypothetical protein
VALSGRPAIVEEIGNAESQDVMEELLNARKMVDRPTNEGEVTAEWFGCA